MLPEAFCERMKKMLGEDAYKEFLASYDRPRSLGLRFNPLKGAKQVFLQEQALREGFHLESVPWAEDGYYYEESDAPGKHPYHEAGVYYIQEPSAMAPAGYIGEKESERVLDLCASPGGKTTQIAAGMKGKGLLVSNEIHPARAKILSENVERMGITNALVLNETPENLRRHFGCFFHRIMVDAPCSGEGMFRKQETAAQEWSEENVRLCGERQDEILEEAYAMLLPGGRLVYSTCTFAPDENEGTICRFLREHSDMHLVSVTKYEGMQPGCSEWCDGFARGVEQPVTEPLEKTIRLWPNLLRGEGHFVAVMEKDPSDTDAAEKDYKREKTFAYKEFKELQKFASETLTTDAIHGLEQGRYLVFGEQLYLVPEELPVLKGLKVMRPGLHIGTLKKNRLDPSHAFALALSLKQGKCIADLTMEKDEETIYAYLRGETFLSEGESGWCLIGVDGYTLGWGKRTGNMVKNHYPKGLRITYRR